MADDTVTKTKYMISHFPDRLIMCNHNDRISILMIDILDQLQNLLGCVVVQCARRFVTEQNIRVFYDRTTDGNTLLLPAGKLIGKLVLMLI